MRRISYAVVGAVLGFVVGVIVAINFVIAAGVDRGYESSLSEVFEANVLVGIVTVIILAAGPVVGAIIADHLRRRTNVP